MIDKISEPDLSFSEDTDLSKIYGQCDRESRTDSRSIFENHDHLIKEFSS